MNKTASREVIASLGEFLRRSTMLSEREVIARMKDLEEGRMRTADSSIPASHHELVAPVADSSRVVGGTGPADQGVAHGAGAWDGSRLKDLQARHPVARAPIAFPEAALRADDVPEGEAIKRLAQLRDHVATQVQAGLVPYLDLPDLHRTNSLHDDRGNLFLGQKVRRLSLDARGARTFMRLLLTAEKASDTLRNGGCTTKRGLYYDHQARLPDANAGQVDSDRAITALANLLGVRRRSLGFVEARRGLVYGRLVVRTGNQVVDLSNVGPGGQAVSRFTDDTEIVSSDAAFILVVEKQSVAFHLAQARLWEKARCVLVCGEGFPSLSAREYVRTLVDTLRIPAFILTDADPGGIQVALTYAHGSITTAIETPWLACNDVWWVGVQPSDIDRYCQSRDLIPFSDADHEAARRLLDHACEAYVGKHLRDEVAILADRKLKVELDALCRHMPRFIDDYLPKKLFESELVKM